MSYFPIDRRPRIALVHEWLVNYAGSERVLEHLLRAFPWADVYSVVDFLDEDERMAVLGDVPVRTTFIQRLPGAKTRFRYYLPLMPLAIEQHDLSGYEIVISSSHAVAKGVLTGPDQLHISYVHSPIRYAWDLQHQYLAESGLVRGPASWLARFLLHYMRLWDVRTACGVDHFVANSGFIARRIEKAYRRPAQVIYPPVDVDAFTLRESKEPFFLTVSRMVPYKRIPLIVEAFSRMPDKRLVVIGDGPELARVKRIAGKNVEVLGHQPSSVVRDHMQRAKAFVFAGEEDFGISLVEAQACGTPVIAFGRGGALEIVRPVGHEPATGVFFFEQSAEAIVEAVSRFERLVPEMSPRACRANAERFSAQVFVDAIGEFVGERWARRVSGAVLQPSPAPLESFV